MSLERWIRGGRLLVTAIVTSFFTLLSLGFTWLCFITGSHGGIGLGLLISSILALYTFVASLVLFWKGREEGVFEY